MAFIIMESAGGKHLDYTKLKFPRYTGWQRSILRLPPRPGDTSLVSANPAPKL